MRFNQFSCLGLALLMALPPVVPAAIADGDVQDGLWLASRCRNPRLARAVSVDRLQGHVTVEFDIQADGRTSNIQLVESDPPNVMDLAAVNAVRGWRYFAYIKDGVEVGRKGVRLTFTFGGEANPNASADESCLHSPWPDATTAQAK